ncbi:MAG: orotidine-5'-phosphate decarboxylase [Bacteroidota bacterium]
MNRKQLIETIKSKKTFLCVGLDTDITKIPRHLLSLEDPVFEFNKQIIEKTAPYTLAYKPNFAFYESMGLKGMKSLGMTMKYLHTYHPDIFTIADAKRGDIGNTSTQYAKSFFEKGAEFEFDAVTVAPYMGYDSVSPFLGFPDKWVILLALTSNKGSEDFQFLKLTDGRFLYEKVLQTAATWADESQMMFVVGATQANMLGKIRKVIPNHFLLVPGVGAQGGNLQEVAHFGMTSACGLIVNASRSILYASSDESFADKAAEEALSLQQEMEMLLKEHKVI